jgi:aryl-alcohol dehydrogenase-like predicted oxidoreductase
MYARDKPKAMNIKCRHPQGRRAGRQEHRETFLASCNPPVSIPTRSAFQAMAPPEIRKVALGKNGPLVGRLGFGAMGMSAFYAPKLQPDEDRLAVLDKAHELGATHWDTSDVYGDNEALIGQWFKKTGKRDEVSLNSFGISVFGDVRPEQCSCVGGIHADTSKIFLATKFAGKFENGSLSVYNEPEYVLAACDSSLERLGVEQIDLFYCHRFNGTVPVEDIVEAMAQLVKYVPLTL